MAYISSCEMDLDGDDESDIVILAETKRGVELIALLKNDDGYNGYVVATDVRDMLLTCKYGDEVVQTKVVSKDQTITKKTTGAYIELMQPECCSVAYVWNGHKFLEIYTSD